VAREAACRPRAALLDEPTAFLNREKREAVFHLMDVRERGRPSNLDHILSPRIRKGYTSIRYETGLLEG